MNLFLLVAVPLAAVAIHRGFHTDRPAFSDPKGWIWGTVWSLSALILASFFGKWREFSGDLTAVFGGLVFTDALLVPGLVVIIWLFTRPAHDTWELGLWLVLAFTLAGIRDFAATTRTFDLTEYFLVPLDRILIVLGMPLLVGQALRPQPSHFRWLWAAAASLLVLTGPLFQVLSFAGWGWTVWVAEALGTAGALLWLGQKKAALPQEGGSSDQA